jgi:hypothetical protein
VANGRNPRVSRGQHSSQSFYVVYCFLKFTPNTYLAVTERPLEKKWPTLETLRLSASRQVAPCRFTRELLKDAMNAADAARRYGYCSVPRVIRLDSVLMLKTISVILTNLNVFGAAKLVSNVAARKIHGRSSIGTLQI